MVNKSGVAVALHWGEEGDAHAPPMALLAPRSEVPTPCAPPYQPLFSGGPVRVSVGAFAVSGPQRTVAARGSFAVPLDAMHVHAPRLGLQVHRTHNRFEVSDLHAANNQQQQSPCMPTKPPQVVVSTRLQWTAVAFSLAFAFAFACIGLAVYIAVTRRRAQRAPHMQIQMQPRHWTSTAPRHSGGAKGPRSSS
jgi:hypothetical protein